MSWNSWTFHINAVVLCLEMVAAEDFKMWNLWNFGFCFDDRVLCLVIGTRKPDNLPGVDNMFEHMDLFSSWILENVWQIQRARLRWYAGPLHDYRFYLANKTNLMGEAPRSFDAEEFLEEFRFGTLEDAVKDKTPMTSILCAKLRWNRWGKNNMSSYMIDVLFGTS